MPNKADTVDRPVVLLRKLRGVPVKILIDSGASHSLVSSSLVSHLHLEVDLAVNLKDACMIDGMPLHIGPVICKLRVVLGPITVRRDFDSATMDGYDFIFGRDWPWTVSTEFDWAQGSCSMKVDGEFRELPQERWGHIIYRYHQCCSCAAAAVGEKANLPAEVSPLLTQFADVFPDELPPENRFPVPRVEDLLDAVQGAGVFSKIDLRSRYHQIQVVPEEQDKTAFRTKQGLYEFRVLPFSLTNAPATFQTLMSTILSEFLGSFVVVYLDDILIFSKTKEEHVKHLQKRFLGFANYYCRFVLGYASIAIPLTDLLRKGVDFEWGPAQQQAFEQMKQSLTSSLTLSYPDPTRPYVVVTGASDRAIGAVLLQDQGRGLQQIAYLSQRRRRIPPPDRPWQVVTMDFIMALPRTFRGHDAIFVVVDKFSRATHFIPTHGKVTAEEAATLFIDNVVRLYGVPDSIISDRDPRFTSKLWKQLFALFGTCLAMSSAYHPEIDRQTERVNQTLEQILRNIRMHDAVAWDKKLSTTEFTYNNTHHSSTGMSPLFALYGQHPNVPTRVDLTPTVLRANNFHQHLTFIHDHARKHLELATARMARTTNRSRREVSFAVGDRVLLDSRNLRLP
ncbi:unnamed protein product [Closterium sp. NIES-53]